MDKILMIAGAVCLYCAASNDGYCEAMGEPSSLIGISLWAVAGIVCLFAGCKMSKLI